MRSRAWAYAFCPRWSRLATSSTANVSAVRRASSAVGAAAVMAIVDVPLLVVVMTCSAN